MAVMPEWWDGRDLRAMLPRIFFEHFRGTSLVAEHEDRLVGFLVGFLCPTTPTRPTSTSSASTRPGGAPGLARDLYRRFFALARAAGRTVVRAVTAPVNTTSIAFHRALGFGLLPGDAEVDGVPVVAAPGPQGQRWCASSCLEPEVRG